MTIEELSKRVGELEKQVEMLKEAHIADLENQKYQLEVNAAVANCFSTLKPLCEKFYEALVITWLQKV